MAKPIVTVGEIQSLLNYNPETGVFTWLVTRPPVVAGDVAGSKFKSGHIYICLGGRSYPAHRLAWLYVHGVWPENMIDHINGVRSDNRIANLRDVTCRVNTQNQRRARSDSVSGLLGVTWLKQTGRWRAAINVNGKKLNLGEFADPEEAHRVYLEAKRRLHPGCTV